MTLMHTGYWVSFGSNIILGTTRRLQWAGYVVRRV